MCLVPAYVQSFGEPTNVVINRNGKQELMSARIYNMDKLQLKMIRADELTKIASPASARIWTPL